MDKVEKIYMHLDFLGKDIICSKSHTVKIDDDVKGIIISLDLLGEITKITKEKEEFRKLIKTIMVRINKLRNNEWKMVYNSKRSKK